jgi:hypothetical protein
MKIALALGAALMLASTTAQAALSGYYDSAAQIALILESEAVANAVHQAPIGHVANTGTRKDGAKEWEVRTQDCDLLVYLIPVPPQMPGPTTYILDLPKACE